MLTTSQTKNYQDKKERETVRKRKREGGVSE